jgi:hypothetical protein
MQALNKAIGISEKVQSDKHINYIEATLVIQRRADVKMDE